MTDVLDDLIINKEHYKELVAPFLAHASKLLDEESNLFRDDILEQFQETTRWLIAQNIHERFNINIDDAYILLENVNIRRLLK